MRGDATQRVLKVGKFDEQVWGDSDERHQDIDLGQLVAASDAFTPADIEHAGQQVAQATFEATLDAGTRVRASTEDYLRAVRQTRPTLDEGDIAAFGRDIEAYQRV